MLNALFPNILYCEVIAVNDLLVVNIKIVTIVTLYQCGVVWNKIIVVAAMLFVVEKRIV